MGEPRKLHSKKCLVTVLTLVWHVTSVTISGRGNIPSKLWAWKETAWIVSKDIQYLSNFWSSEKPTFQFGKPADTSSILPNHHHWKTHLRVEVTIIFRICCPNYQNQVSVRGQVTLLSKNKKQNKTLLPSTCENTDNQVKHTMIEICLERAYCPPSPNSAKTYK